MGFLDRLFPRREKFSQQWSASDPAFAAWWFGDQSDIESVTPYTVLGLSAVLRSVQIISGTIASLPLRTYERQGDDKIRIPSVFDDPYPGIDGMTPFAWVETVLIHLLLWREAFLWHEDIAADGTVRVYRPIVPDAFTVKRENGKRVFEYTENGERKTVGSEQITYIPGPSLDGVRGHPLLYAARSIFSAAISGDKTAQTVLRRGIRLAGLLTPADEAEDFDQAEGEAILEQMRSKAVGRENAGDVVLTNKRIKLTPWTPNNIESQWHETRGDVLGEIGRLFGVPPHLINDIERQTSWGTGVSEQNLGLARYTLMGWTSRIEQTLRLRLPKGQFVEFDYKGLLQGTPAAEIELLIKQVDAGLIDIDEARKVMNLPPRTPAQIAAAAPPPPPAPVALPALAASAVPAEPSRFSEMAAYAQLQATQRTNELVAALAPTNGHTPDVNVTVEPSPVTIAQGAIQFTAPDVHVESPITFDKGSIQVDAPVTVEAPAAPSVTFEDGAIRAGDTHIEPTHVTIEKGAVQVDNPVTIAEGAVQTTVEAPVSLSEGAVTLVEKKPMRTVLERDKRGRITGSHEEPV